MHISPYSRAPISVSTIDGKRTRRLAPTTARRRGALAINYAAKTTNPADDGAPGLFLKNADGCSTKVHPHVNVRAMRFSKADQDRCVFGLTDFHYRMSASQAKHLATKQMKKLARGAQPKPIEPAH